MDRLVPQVRAALLAYQQALLRLGHDVNTGVSADEAAQEAQAQVEQLQLDQAQRVRAIYMAGGQAGLITTVLESQGPADFTERISMLNRVMSAQTTQLQWATEAADAARQDATAGLAQADATGETAGEVQTRYQQLVVLLAAAQSRLGGLSARARTLAAAEAAARELGGAGSRCRVGRHGGCRHRTRPRHPAGVPGAVPGRGDDLPGLDWHVLAAIGQVESGHGHNVGPSSVGAEGPMQFMPATFAGYAVDGNGDGVADIWNPADSIYTAAHYLCANGAGSPAQALHRDLALQPRRLVRADGAGRRRRPAPQVPGLTRGSLGRRHRRRGGGGSRDGPLRRCSTPRRASIGRIAGTARPG